MLAKPVSALKLYRYPLSGHAHRVQLMLSLLQLPAQLVDVDLKQGAHKHADFLALNPFGQVPVLDDNGTILSDSNAILVYLARSYGGESWYPSDALGQAAIQRWLSVAAGQVAHGPAAARKLAVFGIQKDAADMVALAHSLLKLLEGELSRHSFLVGNSATIADVAVYTYIAHAPEGGVSLADYPAVRAWLARIESLTGFVGMQKTAIGLAA
ncbi:MAG: glutathione S-transferase [Pseudomonadota bacterium]